MSVVQQDGGIGYVTI